MGQRLTWAEICRLDSFRGRWVALDHCRYDSRVSSNPIEGEVVDADDDLSELCYRIRERSRGHCAIVFCEADEVPVSSQRYQAAAPLSGRR